MVLTQNRSKRKPTGGRYKKLYRSKRKFEIGRPAVLTHLAPTKQKLVRTKGGNQKQKLLTADTANVYDPKTKKCTKATIKTILENAANRHYVRRNIMTKGTIIDTNLGKAKVTSRPGQEGTVNAVLV